MTSSDEIRDSYNAAAEAYAEHLANELDAKPLDRHLLNRFAEATRGKGLVADIGCGPGHVARYLAAAGVRMTGVDLSDGMIDVARSASTGIDFRTADMRALPFGDAAFAGIVAFYAIVHFTAEELGPVFAEFRRVLAEGAPLLVSFHVGDEAVHVEDLFGVPVSLDFRFHRPWVVKRALETAGFRVIEQVEREPYAGAEYASRRCYLLGLRSP